MTSHVESLQHDILIWAGPSKKIATFKMVVALSMLGLTGVMVWWLGEAELMTSWMATTLSLSVLLVGGSTIMSWREAQAMEALSLEGDKVVLMLRGDQSHRSSLSLNQFKLQRIEHPNGPQLWLRAEGKALQLGTRLTVAEFERCWDVLQTSAFKPFLVNARQENSKPSIKEQEVVSQG